MNIFVWVCIGFLALSNLYFVYRIDSLTAKMDTHHWIMKMFAIELDKIAKKQKEEEK